MAKPVGALYELKRPGLTFQVFRSHLKIINRLTPLGFLFPTTTSIPLRNIAEVEAQTAFETLIIRTNDGKAHKFRLGGFGNAAASLRDAILENM